METVQVSFKEAYENDLAPMTTLHNAAILPLACFSQVLRYGLISPRNNKNVLAGLLKGSQKDFTAMIQSYGFEVRVVPSPVA